MAKALIEQAAEEVRRELLGRWRWGMIGAAVGLEGGA